MSQDTPPLVLVVDDDARSRELMTLVLRHAGFGVVVASHPGEAQALLGDVQPSLAVVDYLMPGMNGLDFCRWVRQQPRVAGMRIVLLTGMDAEETRVEARAAGVDDVVIKPFNRLDLLARLNSLLGSPAAR